MLFILEGISLFVLASFRYSNQGLDVNSFDITKTGNLISTLFFGLILLIILLLIFSGRSISFTGVILSIFISIASVVILIVSYYFSPKDEKIIYSTAFILLNTFIFAFLFSSLLSGTKKLYLFRNIILTIVLFAVGLLIIFLQVYYHKDDSASFTGGAKSDAGVILGAAVWGGNRPSPVLRERINKGYEIYNKGMVPRLVLTGGGSPNEMTEADVERNELMKYGVDKEKLIVENTSNSTMEQILFVRDKLYRKLSWKSIILVSDNYHLMRAKEICNFNNMNCAGISSDTPLSTEGGISFCIKETFAILIFWFFGFG